MNPQQFNNMAGLGNGMPNNMQQMNPAFMNPQMANQMRQQPNMPMQGGMQAQVNSNNAQIQRQIFQSLQSQGQYTTGWQASVTVPERGAQIRQLVDSLRLVRPPVEPPRATEVAIQFERKAFAQSTSKEQYLQECNDKLARIRDQRAQQMNATNMAGMQPQMPMQNQNFMQQMGQQNMTMNPNQQMQQQIFSQQRQPNMTPQTQMMQPQANAQQNPGQKQPDTLSQEDNQVINQRAAELAKNTPKDKMRSIVDGMNPQLRQNLEAKNVDPIIYYFRMLATREFRQTKEKNAQNQMMGTPQQRIMQQAQQPMMNMDRFQSQQNEAMRLQQEGDLVVPASSNQGISPDQLRLQQQMMANSQRMNQQPQNQQALLQRQQQMQLQASKMQQVNQYRQSQQEQGMQPNQTPQQANAGLNMLNRPVGPNGQVPSPQPRPQSRVPQQPGMQGPGQISPQEQQKREHALGRFPVQLQNILRTKPTNEWQATIQQYQARAKMAAQAQQNQGQQFMAAPIPMQQSLSNGGMQQGDGHVPMQNMPPNQAQVNQQMMRQRAMQQQQQMAQAQQQSQQPKPQPQPGQMPQIRPLQPNEVAYMDNVPVPGQVLQTVRQHSRNPLPQLQGNLNWHTLKQWLNQNPVQGINMGHIARWQAQAFFQMQRTKAAAAGESTMAQMPGPQQPPPQQPQPQLPQQQPQQQMANQGVPPIRQITPAEIMTARQNYPQLQNMTDDQVQTALQARARRQREQMAMMQANRQGTQPGQQQTQQTPQPQQVQRPPTQPQQPAQNQQQQQPRPQSQAQDKPQQQQQQNNVQQPNQPVEAPAKPQPAQQQQPPKAGPGMTQEQYNKLPPAQKQAWHRHQQRQAIVKKIMAITTQVQATLTNPPPPSLDDAARMRLAQKLGGDNVKQMLGRIDSFLLAYFEMSQDEEELKKLIKYRTLLFRQYQQKSVQDKSFVPNNNFSLTPEQVDEMLTELSTKFQQTAAAIPRQPTGQQLTPENLKQLEAQEQERKKSVSKGKDVPPAPTSAQPPFSFGGERGHGAPKYAAPGLKVEDLKLPPDPKRRKMAKTPATPSTSAPTPVAPTQTTPQQQKTDLPAPAATFRCAFNNCERQTKGFATQQELEQHTATVHNMVEVSDPIAFLDSALQQAFNLDENLKQIKKPKAQPMQRTTSNLKHESRPGTPSAMARLPSHGGASAKQDEEEDLWQHSNITPQQIEEIFGGMDWEHIVPAADYTLHRRFVDQHKKTDAWLSIFKKPESPETEKSTSPPTGKDAEPKEVDPIDDMLVDFTGIEGLDMETMKNLESDTFGEAQKDADGDSPFEIIGDDNKEAANNGSNYIVSPDDAIFLRKHGLDPNQPRSQMSDAHGKLYDFIITDPQARDREYEATMDGEWVDLSDEEYEAWLRRTEEEARLNKLGKGTPGAYNGNGWNPCV